MDTMKSLNVKNMVYVAAFMAVTGMAQAQEPETASGDTPTTVKDKKTLFQRAQGKVSSLAERAKTKMGIGEEKAEKKVTEGEENLNKRIGKVSNTLGAIKNKATETAACVKKEVYAIELPILRAQSDFFAEQKKRIDMQISDLITKGAAAERACVATGESAEATEEKSK